MDVIATGETIGNIHITVYKTQEGNRFFNIQTDNEEIYPIIDIIENVLLMY